MNTFSYVTTIPGLWATLRSQWNRNKVLDTDTTLLARWKPYRHLPHNQRGWRWSCQLVLLWHHQSQCSSFDLSQAKNWGMARSEGPIPACSRLQLANNLTKVCMAAFSAQQCSARGLFAVSASQPSSSAKVTSTSKGHYLALTPDWSFRFLHPILGSQGYLGTILNW